MMIPADNLLEHLKERMEVIALQCIGDKSKDMDATQIDRGRYMAYKELTNYIATNYSQ